MVERQTSVQNLQVIKWCHKVAKYEVTEVF